MERLANVDEIKCSFSETTSSIRHAKGDIRLTVRSSHTAHMNKFGLATGIPPDSVSRRRATDHPALSLVPPPRIVIHAPSIKQHSVAISQRDDLAAMHLGLHPGIQKFLCASPVFS